MGLFFWLLLSVFMLQSRTESCKKHRERWTAPFLPARLLLHSCVLPITELKVHAFPDWPAQWLSLLGSVLLNSLPGSIPIAAEPRKVPPPKDLQSKNSVKHLIKVKHKNQQQRSSISAGVPECQQKAQRILQWFLFLYHFLHSNHIQFTVLDFCIFMHLWKVL